MRAVAVRYPLRAAQLLNRVQRASSDENAEEPEDAALVLVEQPVAPADRVAQRPLPRGHVARAIGEDREAPIQAGQERLGRD